MAKSKKARIRAKQKKREEKLEKEIYAAAKSGKSVEEICSEYKLKPFKVHSIINKWNQKSAAE